MNKNLRKKIYKKYDGKCFYCGENLVYSQMQIDHIKPIHLRGKTEEDNLVPSCRSCNFYKSTFNIENFRKRIETIPKRLNKIFIFRLALKYGLIELKKKNIVFSFEQCQNCNYNKFCYQTEDINYGTGCKDFKDKTNK